MIRSVVFDVGETLIDETRIFARWADRLGVPHLTLFGLIGAALERGDSLTSAFRQVKPDFDLAVESATWRRDDPDSMRENFDTGDLYPDVRPALAALRDLELRVVIAGNQPTQAGTSLRGMGLPADSIHVSEDWGVAKPDPAFFTRVQEETGTRPGEILYVGDRVDNDVVPAKEAGMATALLRRGMLGYRHATRPEAASADVVLDNLSQLVPWCAGRG